MGARPFHITYQRSACFGSFRPFGKIAWEVTLDIALTKEDKGFLGERYDEHAELQFLNNRYYDPELALFIQPDWLSVTEPGVGTNRYAYASNDPVNRFDPEGNFFGLIAGFIAQALGVESVLAIAAIGIGVDSAVALANGASLGDVVKSATIQFAMTMMKVGVQESGVFGAGPQGSAARGMDTASRDLLPEFGHCQNPILLCPMAGGEKPMGGFAGGPSGGVLKGAPPHPAAGTGARAAAGATAATAAAKVIEGSNGTLLYRVVDDAELADITKTGIFRTAPGGYETGKLFVENLADAQKLQGVYSRAFKANRTIVGGLAPKSVIDSAVRFPFADIPNGIAILIPTPHLPLVRPILP